MLRNPENKYRPFAAPQLSGRKWPSRTVQQAPIWMSTDLRDGNQSLIEPMSIAQKLEFFDMLVQIGFKEIEVGFPSASQTDFDFVRTLIEEKRIPDDVTIEVLVQSREALIARTFEALQGVPRAIVHLYSALCPSFRKIVFNQPKEEVKALAVEGTRLIRQYADAQPETHWIYQYSPETFSMTELAFAREVCDAVAQTWRPTRQHKMILNLPATVEAAMPNVYADQIEWMDRNLGYRDSIVLSVHPHNDRGTAVAAAELALLAGADRIEGCLFGNGERTGNVDLVTLALNLYTQGIDPGLDFSEIDAVRRVVERCNQIPVHPRHPYAGDLVHTAFSGSHQDAIRKGFAQQQPGAFWEVPYLPIDPADIGRNYDAVIRVNSQSGKGGSTYLLERGMGFTPPRRVQIEFSHAVQAVTDESGEEMTGAAICALFAREYFDVAGPLQRASGKGLHWNSRDIPVPNVSAAAGASMPETQAHAISQALQPFAGQPVEITSYEMLHTANGQVAVFAGCRIGGQAPCFGVGIGSDEADAVLDALVSGINRAVASTLWPVAAQKAAA
ncbi:2-isopropylmalate synthase [Paraburkholderia bonniea]|uniref:2-isopropylmalate synthase n=1 Tax=Paraburkholderia bonniea TaxID=2152891 RepID=UPI0012929982|nr:2-isopropylmalate synthase [Paraburkholderia bonniea]WJF89966.1 2-isopropylmalate synthase [Paraburkholderia bonniea]WJF93280.1 2-isopropylmalate synthase [Paraburkholderia bonniea]